MDTRPARTSRQISDIRPELYKTVPQETQKINDHGKRKPDSVIMAQDFQSWSMSLNFSGVWKGNLRKSKVLGPAPKAVLVRINHIDPELIVEMVITKRDDTENRLLFRGLTTGEEVSNSVDGVQVRSRSHWVGAELLIESWMNVGGREGHFRDYWSLSDGGRTLTMEHRDDDLAGQITHLERTHVH